MQTVSIEDVGAKDFEAARASALKEARRQFHMPVILSWHDSHRNTSAPEVPGAETRKGWRGYGESSGGALEVDVESGYQFIFADAASVDSPGERFTKLTDTHGHEFLCLPEACTAEERQRLGADPGQART